MSIKRNHLFFTLGLVASTLFVIFWPSHTSNHNPQTSSVLSDSVTDKKPEEIVLKKVSHVKTPEKVKAIYMSSWVAATPSFRQKLLNIIDETEINTIVLDIKDYTGNVAFLVNNPELKAFNSSKNRIKNIDALLSAFHDKNIYVIGRIAVFQDPIFIMEHPDQAVKDKSKVKVWRDRKGIPWVDAGSKTAWDYISLLSKESYDRGFDEINLDYIRFPSDGNMKEIYFPVSGDRPKREVMKEFFAYMDTTIRGVGIPVSADLFGLTTTAKDDLGIGQVWEDAIVHFDFVAPMVYPSHFAKGALGFKNPSTEPYGIIKSSLTEAIRRTEVMGEPKSKIRPWLQDFDLGAKYTAEMVRAQIRASEELGITSWMLWDPSNQYTRGALRL